MAKNLKLNIKNTQIAKAVNLKGLKEKLAEKKSASETGEQKAIEAKPPVSTKSTRIEATETEIKEEIAPRKARTRSAFAEPQPDARIEKNIEAEIVNEPPPPLAQEEEEELVLQELSTSTEQKTKTSPSRRKTSEELRKEIFAAEIAEQQKEAESPPAKNTLLMPPEETTSPPPPAPSPSPISKKATPPKPRQPAAPPIPSIQPSRPPALPSTQQAARLGPTGKHINDLLPTRRPSHQAEGEKEQSKEISAPQKFKETEEERNKVKTKVKGKPREEEIEASEDSAGKKSNKATKFKEFRDIKPTKKIEQSRFDARDRQGLRASEEEQQWRKKRSVKMRPIAEDVTIRPSHLKIRIPIAIKDLASEMKLKASQLIAKLFSQGVAVTLNDLLEDETTIQLLGHEFNCEIEIDTTEEQRIRITDKTIREEIQEANPEKLIIRPPIVAFMGHVDHGKTSLIDAIRKSNRVAGEAGAITQHIGAFRCSTSVGDIAILDTPGHEAFSAMRARGAEVTDIVVLVVAGDEGIKQQTLEALNHAKAAKVTIVVAINKCDKPNFNAENVYRQLAENELLPEVWGGQTITINTSATTGQGISELLEMLALQAEVLELKADPTGRARGTVLESEMHKGMGSLATVLVQNGTLNCGDALVFGQYWGRVKTMRDEFGRELNQAGPSTPVEITGISGLPEAGQEFIVVKNEREAREIAEARMQGMRQFNFLQMKKLSIESLIQQGEVSKKILNVVIRADVQGSLEALKAALLKIESQKAELNIIFTGVGEISESDIQLASASHAVVIGFHTQIESHAEALMKELGVQVKLHNIIYHAIDDAKILMAALLDKIAKETEKGKAEVKATFKSSHHGIIAGCMVTEGSIQRSNFARIRRGKEIIWTGNINSLKRVKEDVREVTKGLECGIILANFNDVQVGDIIEAYEITYITQEL